MPGHIYTIEELLLNDSFIDYCLSTGSAMPSEWRTIIRDNPQQETTFEEAKKLVLLLHGGLNRLEVSRQIEKVRRQLAERSNAAVSGKANTAPALSSAYVVTDSGRISRRSLRKLVAYALVFCLLLTAGGLYFFRQAKHPVTAIESNSPSLLYQSPAGQRTKIVLPDGTGVILNSGSSITIDNSFNGNDRIVHLTGNAFFQVAANAVKPFIVYSGTTSTTALGTEFFVHGNPQIPAEVRIELLEGKVRVNNINREPSAGVILNPGDAGIKRGSQIIKQPFDSLRLRKWIDGTIRFNEKPFLEAIDELEEFYEMEIRVKAGSNVANPISGSYTNEPIQDILQVICFANKLRYSITGNTITIE